MKFLRRKGKITQGGVISRATICQRRRPMENDPRKSQDLLSHERQNSCSCILVQAASARASTSLTMSPIRHQLVTKVGLSLNNAASVPVVAATLRPRAGATKEQASASAGQSGEQLPKTPVGITGWLLGSLGADRRRCDTSLRCARWVVFSVVGEGHPHPAFVWERGGAPAYNKARLQGPRWSALLGSMIRSRGGSDRVGGDGAVDSRLQDVNAWYYIFSYANPPPPSTGAFIGYYR